MRKQGSGALALHTWLSCVSCGAACGWSLAAAAAAQWALQHARTHCTRVASCVFFIRAGTQHLVAFRASPQVIEVGANAIVSGSGVFGAKDYAAAIKGGFGAAPGAFCTVSHIAAACLRAERGCCAGHPPCSGRCSVTLV